MRSLTIATAATLLATWVACAADRAPVRADFARAYPGVHLQVRHGQLTRVYGVPFGFGESPEKAAESFVRAYCGLWGVPAQDLVPGRPSDGLYTLPLVYDPDTGRERFVLVHYAQHHGGLAVHAAELRLLVLNQPGYPLVWAGSTLRDLGDFMPRVPVIVAADAAHAAATAEVASLDSFTPGELVIYAGHDATPVPPTVALAFTADNSRPATADYQKWFFLADAATGTILHRENRIAYTDMTGSVHGQATTIPKSSECNPEVDTRMPWAKVAIGTTIAYADSGGNFIISNPGTTPVTVTSYMGGRYFEIVDLGGPLETLNLNVTPPGPANFMHNAANTSEFIRAEVNAYVQANVARDFVLTYAPQYPTISTQTGFLINVNINGTCGAYYSGDAINFYRAGSGCTNTAYSSVVHHEYGHHVVACGGSGQGAYGEGIGDSLAMLISDDPVLGYGFIIDQCDTGIRTGVNTAQYPCYGYPTECAELLSGCIWSTRDALKATHPDTYRLILNTLAINSILLHTGDQITPDITIDFLVLDDDDGDIGNGTPHYNEICTGFGMHNMDCPPTEIAGDLNCDGLVNFGDIDPFVLALSDQASYEAQYPHCRWLNGDCNGDGAVDFGDIDPFVAILSGG